MPFRALEEDAMVAAGRYRCAERFLGTVVLYEGRQEAL